MHTVNAIGDDLDAPTAEAFLQNLLDAGAVPAPLIRIMASALGEGALRPQLEALIRQHNLEGRFVLLGARENPYPFLRQCDIYVHATYFEGWSIAVAEAKVLCRPIVASDITGIREQLTNETAVIIPPEPDALTGALRRLVDSPDLRAALSRSLDGDWRLNNDLYKLYGLL